MKIVDSCIAFVCQSCKHLYVNNNIFYCSIDQHPELEMLLCPYYEKEDDFDFNMIEV